MKKSVKIVIVGLLALLVIVLTLKIVDRIHRNEEMAARLKTVPDFRFYTLDSIPFTRKDIKWDSRTVFMFYSPDCESCNHEAVDIMEHKALLDGCQLIMVTGFPVSAIKKFGSKYGLSEMNNITMLKDAQGDMYKCFGVTITPSFFYYDVNKQLVKKYAGETKIATVLNAL